MHQHVNLPKQPRSSHYAHLFHGWLLLGGPQKTPQYWHIAMPAEELFTASLSDTRRTSIRDIAGAQLCRIDRSGAFSTIKVGGTFNNLDGLGYKLRVRYDKPKWYGFTLATSVGTQLEPTTTDIAVWDIAIKYDDARGEFRVLRVQNTAALSEPGQVLKLNVDGEVFVLHRPTDLRATLVGGFQYVIGRDACYVYGKLGYQADLT